MAAGISTTKLFVLAVLGFCAVLLGGAVLTFQIRVTMEKQKRGLFPGQKFRNNLHRQQRQKQQQPSQLSQQQDGQHPQWPRTTVKWSSPTGSWDLNLGTVFPAPDGSSFKTRGDAYWHQVQAFLRGWDVMPDRETDFFGGTTAWQAPGQSSYQGGGSGIGGSRASHPAAPPNDVTAVAYPRLALELAADAGHPTAQHYLANALASGIWPVPAGGGAVAPPAFGGVGEGQKEPAAAAATGDAPLHVFDEWTPSTHGDHPQVARSFLLWHMAAQAGNIEAAMALASRLDQSMDGATSSPAAASASAATCQDSLPYYRAAADGIMDQLESSSQSRAKLVPPMDKHSLAQVHMHGGASSQLDWNNKPDESREALQFYHLKATTVPWSMTKKAQNEGDGDESGGGDRGSDGPRKQRKLQKKKKKKVRKTIGIDVSAAYTLGHLYHYGFRGVKQNLTKSVEYYEIAGINGHWESSGHACNFYLWGIGVQQDVNEALTYCTLGAPLGLDGCWQRHEMIQADAENVAECDENALNGLGLLHLLGVEGRVNIDLVAAEKYFMLAKALGNADAAYNLGMMYLGWKTHFKNVLDLDEDGVSAAEGVDSRLPPSGGAGGTRKSGGTERFALHVSKLGKDQVFKGPLQDDTTQAIKLLTAAANKGHVQAKHRLGMIYAEGITLQTSVLRYESVKTDCAKAKGMFQWIVDNASPTRSKRLRRAYKDYISGNLETSLRNYLAAAETGSSVGQVNAAFLMERGVCLGLDAVNCAKASVRLWKAAAARGHAEACLRVGDFYYYGRLRGNKLPVGPFGWIQYILYPEKYLPILVSQWASKILASIRDVGGDERIQACDGENGSCKEGDYRDDGESEALVDVDLNMAAHFYQVAVERHQSPRANFNLGFMHQWGLGLKQDFPLAKRHYDLAASGNLRESELVVQTALMAMNGHETIIRWKVMLEDWWYKRETKSMDEAPAETITPPRTMNPHKVGEPVPSPVTTRRSREEIVMSHIFNWSSFVILVLIMLLVQVMVMMKWRQQRR